MSEAVGKGFVVKLTVMGSSIVTVSFKLHLSSRLGLDTIFRPHNKIYLLLPNSNVSILWHGVSNFGQSQPL